MLSCGSAGKESTCSAGDPSLIPGLGRSPGEGRGSPLQYSWASLVAQTVKSLPAMRETWVRSLGWEGPLEKGKATHSSVLAGRAPWTEEPGGLRSMRSRGVRRDRETEHRIAVSCSAAQWCLCDPTACSSLYGLFPARTLEWVVISSPRRSS